MNAGNEVHMEHKWGCRRNSWLWGCRHCHALLEALDSQPEEFSEGQLININEECGCDEKDDNVPEEVMLTKNFTLKEF